MASWDITFITHYMKAMVEKTILSSFTCEENE